MKKFAFIVFALLSTPAFAGAKRPAVNLDPLHLFQTGASIPILGTPPSLYAAIGETISGLQKFTVEDAQAALADAASLNVSTPGSGYKAGDSITVAGGLVAVKTVSATGGIMTAEWAGTPELFSVQPGAVPVISATGGTGSGATFTQNDTQAAACWQIMATVGASINNPLPPKPGLMLAIQKTRDLSSDANSLLTSVQSGPINQYCAPLITTTLSTINGIAAKGAAAAAAIAIAVPK